MASEVEMFRHFDDMMLLLVILQKCYIKALTEEVLAAYPFPQVVKYLNFDQSLVMETFFVSNYFDSHRFTSTMIAALKDLTERPFAQSINNFIAIRQVVMIDHKIISTLIIVAKVICRIFWSRGFFLAPAAKVVN
jgi:hypothetical protein